jgi:hypothetical protein
VLEVLSCGVPCICSDVGGCAETVRHDQEGFILHENTPEEIAACIKRMADSAGLWMRLSGNGMIRHEEMFTTARMAACWEELYLETAQRQSEADAPDFSGRKGTVSLCTTHPSGGHDKCGPSPVFRHDGRS